MHNDQIAKLMAVLELTTRGTPQMYYGEELGMRTTDPARIEDVHDPIGKLGWPKEKGRDGERTPMQWDGSRRRGLHHCGQAVAADSAERSRHTTSRAESKDPDSIFNAYKRCSRCAKRDAALRDGTQESHQ